MAIVKLGYGKTQVTLEINDSQLMGVIDVEAVTQNSNPMELVQAAINQPIGTPALARIVQEKNAKSALIVVNDITRPTPYQWMLPPLIAELNKSGIPDTAITLLVATGIHRPHNAEENRKLYGEEICSRIRVVSHDCDHQVVSIGRLPDGTPLMINRLVKEHDLLITTGLIGLHYFAGYSGGRKSILPGIASRELIAANHAMMVDERCRLDNIDDNPVHKIMVEAAYLAGVDFILNAVTDAHGHLVAVVAGELLVAWEYGVQISRRLSTVDINQAADVVVASCGGFPKDINLYQAQKALDGAALAVKPGGTIILVAECGEALGEDTFAKWIEENNTPEEVEKRIKTRFELGGHKAYAISRLARRAQIILVSSLAPSLVKKCFMTPAADVDEALAYALRQQGEQAKILVMPHAANIAVRITGR